MNFTRTFLDSHPSVKLRGWSVPVMDPAEFAEFIADNKPSGYFEIGLNTGGNRDGVVTRPYRGQDPALVGATLAVSYYTEGESIVCICIPGTKQ